MFSIICSCIYWTFSFTWDSSYIPAPSFTHRYVQCYRIQVSHLSWSFPKLTEGTIYLLPWVLQGLIFPTQFIIILLIFPYTVLTLGMRRDAWAVIQFASFRIGPKMCMQNTKTGSLWRQTKDTEEVQFVSYLLKLVGPCFGGWRKLHIYELSAVNTNPRLLIQPVQLLFVGCIRSLPTASSALVCNKPFCMETCLRHYSQKTNAKLTEPLDIKPEPVVNF